MEIFLNEIYILIIFRKYMRYHALIHVYLHLSFKIWKTQIFIQPCITRFSILPKPLLRAKKLSQGRYGPDLCIQSKYKAQGDYKTNDKRYYSHKHGSPCLVIDNTAND